MSSMDLSFPTKGNVENGRDGSTSEMRIDGCGTNESLPELSVVDLAAIYSNERRNLAIEALLSGGVSLRDMADIVAEKQFGPGYSSEQRKSVYSSLKQSHLPRLDTKNVVDYDSRRGRIEPGTYYEIVREVLVCMRSLCGE